MKRLSADIPVPLPGEWTKIYQELVQLRKQRNDPSIPEPPTPLILAGAAFSTASEIRNRWSKLIEWANQYGFVEEMKNLIPPSPDFDVAEKIAGISKKSDRYWWEELGNEEN